MRQAGRYLPEYREIRGKATSFLDFCYTPKLAAEATLQPIKRFGFDAAILFSDILVVPDAMGQVVSFESGEGPRLNPISDPDGLKALRSELDLGRLAPVFETVGLVKTSLPAATSFIGFCGAPWTVASYMIAGRGTPDQAPARLFAYRYPQAFDDLIQRLIEASIAYLGEQIRAGVEVVQIFDTWAGVLPAAEFDRWCMEPIKKIIGTLRKSFGSVPVIAFPRGAGLRLQEFSVHTGAEALGLDTSTDPYTAARVFDPRLVLQGNLDPLVLLAGGNALIDSTRRILEALSGRPHIFNLGHGILPETPLAHVELLLNLVRSESHK
jgi:uroporphyrinogen decarboxylase